MSTTVPTISAQQAPENSKLKGFQATANLMGSYPEIAIFRRFRNAGAQDLLYRELELQQLFQTWADQVADDATSEDPHVLNFEYVFAEQLSSVTDPNAEKGQQRRIWLKISPRLESYCTLSARIASICISLQKTDNAIDDAILRFQRICNLPTADKEHLSLLRLHINSQVQGQRYPHDVEAKIYQDLENPQAHELISADLISVTNCEEEDLFTRIANGPALDIFHKCFGRRRRKNIEALRLAKGDVVEYPYKAYTTRSSTLFAGLLYGVLTSVLIVAAILLVSSVRSFRYRIILIMVCNFIFTVAMAFSVKGKPKDFFGVAAAYAAVLVVFAQGPTTSTST